MNSIKKPVALIFVICCVAFLPGVLLGLVMKALGASSIVAQLVAVVTAVATVCVGINWLVSWAKKKEEGATTKSNKAILVLLAILVVVMVWVIVVVAAVTKDQREGMKLVNRTIYRGETSLGTYGGWKVEVEEQEFFSGERRITVLLSDPPGLKGIKEKVFGFETTGDRSWDAISRCGWPNPTDGCSVVELDRTYRIVEWSPYREGSPPPTRDTIFSLVQELDNAIYQVRTEANRRVVYKK